ncbi:MAG: hypothetical protein Q8O67_23940 [Deltaproteobacteria bacterium]|nr:hypothetical protein [Deltaproteobacteria bacterium]
MTAPVTSAGGLALDNTPRGCARHPGFLAAGGCECGAPLCSACLRSLAHARCGACRVAAGEGDVVVDSRWRADLLVDALKASFAAIPRRAPLLLAMALVSFALAAAGLLEDDADERLRAPAALHLEAEIPARAPLPVDDAPAPAADDDNDGIDDADEARWLERVRPVCEGPLDLEESDHSCSWPSMGAQDSVLPDDEDSDRDNVSDKAEGLKDEDRDGVPDFADPTRSTRGAMSDDDDDGIPNVRELAIGSSPFASDSDGDELPDQVETRVHWGAFPVGGNARIDTDHDGTVDARDLDSDDDGVEDQSEPQLTEIDLDDSSIKWLEPDSDGDGVPNFRDVDDDDDAILTVIEIEDVQGFDSSGYLPAFSNDGDDDGVPDVQEAHLDRNADGIADERQSDDHFAGPSTADERASRFSVSFAMVMVLLSLLVQPLLPASLVHRARRRAVLARVAFGALVFGAMGGIAMTQALAGDDVSLAAFLLTFVMMFGVAPVALTLLGQLALALPVSLRGLVGAGVAHVVVMTLVTFAQIVVAVPLLGIAVSLPAGPGQNIAAVACAVVVAVILLVGMGGFAAGSARFSADRQRR